MEEVKLHGHRRSPFSCRVTWAMKLKGIPYEFIDEDLPNKSPLLLKYNPVHKKIPVLVHGQKALCESMLIVEYIDETWPDNSLLPNDPYDRAVARFWVKFIEDKGLSIWIVYRTKGEEQEKAIKDTVEMLKTIEAHALGDKKYFGGDQIGIVDIAFGAIPHWLSIIEEVVGVKILQSHSFPRLHTWSKNFEDIIKENLPDRQETFVYFKRLREVLMASPA